MSDVIPGLPEREGWEPWSGLGDGQTWQAYRTAGDYGVMGSPGRWKVVFAEDGEPFTDILYVDVEAAMDAADEEAESD